MPNEKSILSRVGEWLENKAAPTVAKRFGSHLREAQMKADYMEESMNMVMLEMENLQYQRLTSFQPEYQYTPRHIANIVKLSVQMALKNPVTCRSINVQADYVFGQGVTFNANHPLVQKVIDDFVDYRANRKALTEHSAMLRAEKRQQVYGSLFFALYTNQKTGRVVVRNLQSLEVTDVITDPEDREREVYIKRCISAPGGGTIQYVYHPALGITQGSGFGSPQSLCPSAEDGEVLWDAPVLHIAYNRLGQEKFAIPEVYPQLDWALAYKRTLEQWISILASYARMAMKITGLSGKRQAAAAKGILGTQVGISNPLEGNPSSVAGSLPLFGKGVDIEPIKTAGATTPPSDADPILNMAGCGVGLPNTFFGDAGKGNFATAKTLDRPTELKMTSRQKLWMEIFRDILEYVIAQSCIAVEGMLRLAGGGYNTVEDPFTGELITLPVLPMNTDPQFGEVGQPIDGEFSVYFPDVLERNVTDRVRALVNAVTLFGKPLMDIVPDKRLIAQWLLESLNIPNAKSYIPGFVAMWDETLKNSPDSTQTTSYIIQPPPAAGSQGQGAEDPSQGGDVGENG
jgi:hypothetical protein